MNSPPADGTAQSVNRWPASTLTKLERNLAKLGGEYPCTIAAVAALIAASGWLYEVLSDEVPPNVEVHPANVEVRVLQGNPEDRTSEVATTFSPGWFRGDGKGITIQKSEVSARGVTFRHETDAFRAYLIKLIATDHELLLLLNVDGEDGQRAFRVDPAFFEPISILITGYKGQRDTLLSVVEATQDSVTIRPFQSKVR